MSLPNGAAVIEAVEMIKLCGLTVDRVMVVWRMDRVMVMVMKRQHGSTWVGRTSPAAQHLSIYPPLATSIVDE